ncbi:MAG: hypothetical protein E7301_02610 [Butyrivibrio sp.]|nr:hypothetical protein [Butyrivibrio sp.]
MAFREKYIPGFEQNNNLIRSRLRSYFFSYVIANLANMLLTNIDGIILGNYVGSDALSAVNIFYPINIMVASVTTLLCAGVSKYIPVIIGKNDTESLDRAYSAISFLKKVLAISLTVVQFPVTYIVVKAFGLSPDLEKMIWAYALGVMVSRPLELYYYVACDELISIGKVKVFTTLSMISAILNLVFDYLLVAVLGLGIMGAGLCTGICIIAESIIIQIYIRKKTNLRNFKKLPCRKEIRALLESGVSASALQMLGALQGVVMIYCITQALGEIGAASMSVLALCNNIVMAIFSGVTKASSPLVGMYYSSGNYEVVDRVMSIAIKAMTIMSIILAVVIYIFTDLIYIMFGFRDISEIQRQMLWIYTFYLILQWIYNAMKIYIDSTLQNKLSLVLNVAVTLGRIAVTFGLLYVIGGISVMWGYVIPIVIILAVTVFIYLNEKNKQNEAIGSGIKEYLFISLKQNEGSILPEKVENELISKNVPKKLAGKIALTIEELIFIVKKKAGHDTDIDICVVSGEDNVLMMWDNGPPSELTSYINSQPEEIFSAFLVRSIAKDLQCSRVYDLNYVTVKL